MIKEFKDKNYWALILGGSSGLGLASAKKLAKHGMNICIVHRNRKVEMEKIKIRFNDILSEGVEFLSFNSDAVLPEKRNAVITEIKDRLADNKIKVLVHSIARGNLKPMIDKDNSLKNDDFLLTINSMAVSLYDWVKELFLKNLFTQDSRIISFTSEGNSKAWKNYAAVSSAKAALEAITRNIALEFAPFGLKANCIQAGITDTESFRKIPGYEKLKELTMHRNPFKRLTTPEDIANAVYLLSLDEAAWINGAVIPVNGGEHLS